MHRFGIDSFNDLFIHALALREYQFEQENEEQIKLDLSKTLENHRRNKMGIKLSRNLYHSWNI